MSGKKSTENIRSENSFRDEDFRNKYAEMFRPKTIVDAIAGLPERKGYTRKGVIMNYKHLGYKNVDKHLNAGYEIVLSQETVQDDRKFSPDNALDANRVPAPIIKRSADGYEYLIMEIETTKLHAFKVKEADEFEQQRMRSVKSEKRIGDTIKSDGGELQFGNKTYK